MPRSEPPRVLRRLAGIQQPPAFSIYPDYAALALRLRSVNPRLSAERAAFLSRHVSRLRPDGQVEMACDPWHKLPLPSHYRVEDSMACWRRIEVPVLLLLADHGFVHKRFGGEDPAEDERRIEVFRELQVEAITDSGHNVQHDQPEQVAAALEDFLT